MHGEAKFYKPGKQLLFSGENFGLAKAYTSSNNPLKKTSLTKAIEWNHHTYIPLSLFVERESWAWKGHAYYINIKRETVAWWWISALQQLITKNGNGRDFFCLYFLNKIK